MANMLVGMVQSKAEAEAIRAAEAARCSRWSFTVRECRAADGQTWWIVRAWAL